jgi:beta-galactosidase
MSDKSAQPAAEAPEPVNRLYLGAAYYPEHWPEERWPEDIRLMQAAGFNVARLGEFAWSTFEPAEGAFHFDWLERAVSLLAEAGIQSVLGTPTAAPPAWLVTRYPETLAVDESGRKVQFGNRCHYCVNSGQFHQSTRKIVAAMAERFGPNHNVIGWQLDNEYNQVCYCDLCRERFQQYLAERYDSLDELNRRWSTAYWSQTYSAWEQIPLPIGAHNPGLMLEFKRFITDSYRRFQELQLDALRPHLRPEVWVTHNFMGWFDGFDHYALSEDLDMASWDYYVGTGQHDYLRHGAVHDLTRGFKRKNFWVMETQPGSVNWSSVNNALNRGEARAMAWQAIGHGADGILYWQWRSALGGQEQYHGTLVDPSGQPRPFYQEAAKLGRDFQALGDLLAGSEPVKARIAILNDYESRWSIQWQKHHQEYDYVQHLLSYYRPLSAQNFPVDILSTEADLDGYRLVIVPSLVIVDEGLKERLEKYVHGGGYLVLTPRTGMKDRDNALQPSRQPGPLRDLAGVEVEEYYALPEKIEIIPVSVTKKFRLTGHTWAERLKIVHTSQLNVYARYGESNGWLDDQIAITVRSYGYGLVYCVGACLDELSMQRFMEDIQKMLRMASVLATPANLEACKRIRPDGEEVFILVNHQPVIRKISMPWPAQEHISGQRLEGEVRMAPYGVAVLTRLPEEPETPAETEQAVEPEPTETGAAAQESKGSADEKEPRTAPDAVSSATDLPVQTEPGGADEP